jgi:hypothetical protein
MNVLKHLGYVLRGHDTHSMWVWGLNQCTMTSFVARVTQESRQLPKFETNKYGGCGMMVDPSAHQWHIICFKRLGYVWCRCENHSMWVWDHNQCTMTSFVAKVWPERIPPQLCNLDEQIWWMWHDQCSHPYHMNVPKYLVYVWIGCKNHSIWVWGLNQCTMTSFSFAAQVQVRPKNSTPAH